MSSFSKPAYSASELVPVFRRLLPTSCLQVLLESTTSRFYLRIFSPLVILWGWVFQAWSSDHSCADALVHLEMGELDELEAEEGWRWRKRLLVPLSKRIPRTTPAYCQAKRRCPVGVLQKCVYMSAQELYREANKHWDWMGRRVFLLDGTKTLTQASPELIAHYGRTKNQKGESHWPIIQWVASFDLHTGAAVALVDGTIHTSEQFLAAQLFQQVSELVDWPAATADQEGDPDTLEALTNLREGTSVEGAAVYVGDRNFGVFLVAQAAVASGHDVVLRLTPERLQGLIRRPAPGVDTPTTIPQVDLSSITDKEILWHPSRQDQVVPTALPEHKFRHAVPVSVHGRVIRCLIERPGFQAMELFLFTTLTDQKKFSAQDIVDLYGYRWRAELDFREIKATLELGHLRTKSVDMVRKELLAGVLAYNMIRGIMLLAAAQLGCDPHDLGFQRCWHRFQLLLPHLLKVKNSDTEEMSQYLHRFLEGCASARIYRRQKDRHPARAVRSHPKSYPFLKGERSNPQSNKILATKS